MDGVRKRTRHCGKYGISAEHIQVTYFKFSGMGKQKTRKRKQEATPPKQKQLNDKRTERYFEALFYANFHGGDFYVTCTYDSANKPQSAEDAARDAANYMKRLNYARKKKGLAPVKYIIITEGKIGGRVHHHIVMDGQLSRDEVEEKWGKGFCNADRLQPEKYGGLERLINYLTKEMPKDPKGRRRWISSQNLTKPWESVNDAPRMMSKKKFAALQEMPEDAEAARQIIEADNPGYKLDRLEKDYSEEWGRWYVFCRMSRKRERDAADGARIFGKARSGGNEGRK